MDVVKIKNQGICSEDMSPEQSVSPEISSTWDDFRDSEAFSRIGDEYQAVIPPLVVKSDYLELSKSQVGGLHDIYIGHSAPVAHIDDIEIRKQMQHNGSDDIFLALNHNDNRAVSEMQDVSEATEVRSCGAISNKELEHATSSSTNVFLLQEMKMKLNESNVENSQWFIPVSLNDSWSDIEMASLLLGLYIFGKNLVQVKKFVGTKQMGDILSFYYGKFYGSEKYRKWSACRKARGKKCVCGQKLFSGWRQQELSTRLLSSLAAEEKQNTLVEVSRGFIEGKVQLEEYVFSLKASVGLNALVEAVGIGKGKQDLTSTTTDSIKSNNAHPGRPEIPVGKAWSTLTPVEIVKFLTGGFRLSKARSSDLFWEAVWPLLLAKGWHSEQANSYGTFGLKHSLVFLIPGVKKFCRRKQVKGEQYFDSVSDVLSKVASDPGLLELDSIVEKHCSDKEENELTSNTKQEQEGFPSLQRYCYLKPKTPVRSTDTMKFMVVDTSLANGSTYKVRELRSLPAEIANTHVSKSDSEDDEQISSEISMNDTHSDNTMHFDEEVTGISSGTRINLDEKVHIDEETCVGSSSNNESPDDGLHSTNISAKIQEDEQSLSDNTQQRNAVQSQMSVGKPKSEIDFTAYTKPSWELNTCSQQASCNLIKIFTGPEVKEEHSSSDHYDLKCDILHRVDSSKENLPLSSLSMSSTVTSCVNVPNVVEVSQSRHVPRTLIDLNLPIPPNSDNHCSFTMEIKGQKDRPNTCSESVDISERDSTMISRRQSNRNRPPTTRALEAHALGLLDVKQKRKSKDVFLEENCMLRTSEQTYAKVRHTDKLGNGIVNFKLESRESNVCNDNGNIFHKLEV